MKPEELFDNYQFWRREGLTPISNIQGYATLLLDGHFGELTKEQKGWLQLILQNSTEARQSWDDFGEDLRISYQFAKDADETIPLAGLIKSLFFRLEHYKYFGQTKTVEVEIPDSLQSIKINSKFITVCFYLLAPSFKLLHTGHNVNELPTFTPAVSAVQLNNSGINISIRSMVLYFRFPEMPIDRFPYSNMDINLADYILKQKGIPLKAELLSSANEEFTVVNFQFEAPIEIST